MCRGFDSFSLFPYQRLDVQQSAASLLRIDRGDIRAFTRRGQAWTDKYGRVVEASTSSSAGSIWLVAIH
jgi:hypothetical protein